MQQSEFERVMRSAARQMLSPKPNIELIERERQELNGLISMGASLLTEQQRTQAKERLEHAQAERWVGAVRAAGERPSLAPPPIVSPDTTWSGDLGTLVELCNLGVRRTRFLFEQRARGYGRTVRAQATHGQP